MKKFLLNLLKLKMRIRLKKKLEMFVKYLEENGDN